MRNRAQRRRVEDEFSLKGGKLAPDSVATPGGDISAAITEFITDEVQNFQQRNVQGSEGVEPRSQKADDKYLERLQRRITKFTRVSPCMIDVTRKLMADKAFCVSDPDRVPNLTKTQQAVFAACSPLLARNMPGFAVAAQPGAGKTLMSILAAVRWTIGGVAEREWHEKNNASGPRPYMAQSATPGTWELKRPSSALCLYVVPRAVLYQTIDSFQTYVPMFGLDFERRGGMRALTLDFAWDTKLADPPRELNVSRDSMFWCTECEDFWFAPMFSSQWDDCTQDRLQRRVLSWSSRSQSDEKALFSQFQADTNITFIPAKITYRSYTGRMVPRGTGPGTEPERKQEYELRIAFTALEDLLQTNLNHDFQATSQMKRADYFRLERDAVFKQGLQALATPRVRYVVCDEFHQPLERVLVDSEIKNFFAHPGASNLINLIGSKTANAHIFCDPPIYEKDFDATVDFQNTSVVAPTGEEQASSAWHQTFRAQCTKLAVALATSRVLPTDALRDAIAWGAVRCKRAEASSPTPYGWLATPRPSPQMPERPHYGTQTLLMTGTPPDPEATALWLALCAPVNMLKNGGFVLQSRYYTRPDDPSKLRLVATMLLPRFLWRYDVMGAGVAATPEMTPATLETGEHKQEPTAQQFDPGLGEVFVSKNTGDYAQYVTQCAGAGCIIAFVGSKHTTPYWHYEHARGLYPVLKFDNTDGGFKVQDVRSNGENDGPCEQLTEQGDKLYNSMLYGSVCPARVVPTDADGQETELEDWQSVWHTIKNMLTNINELIDLRSKIAQYKGTPSAGHMHMQWAQYQYEFLKNIENTPRVLVVYAGPAPQWPVFLDSVPDEADFGVGWLGTSAFDDQAAFANAVAMAKNGGVGRSGPVTIVPPDGFPSQEILSNALRMGTDQTSPVNLFVLNAHSSTGIDLPHVNVVIYVGDEGNKEQMLSRSSRLCKAMPGVDPSKGDGLGSFVVLQILPSNSEYRFTDRHERSQRVALTMKGIEHCFDPDSGCAPPPGSDCG